MDLKWIPTCAAVLAFSAATVYLTGCDDNDFDDAVDDTGDAIEDGADEIEVGTEELGDEIEERTD